MPEEQIQREYGYKSNNSSYSSQEYDSDYNNKKSEEELIREEERRIRNSYIVFVPHNILRGLSTYYVSRFMFSNYTIYDGLNSDGTFIITDQYGNYIDESYCFIFTFACRGIVYWSNTRQTYDGPIDSNLQRDINISKQMPDNVYVILGRTFYFSNGNLYP